MSVKLPNGVVFSLGVTLDSAKSVTAVTNANPAVASSATHGYNNGDLVLLKSGWQKASERIWRVANKDVGTFEIEGLDATATSTYPPGAGVGTVAKVSAWTQITQVLECTTNGGDMQFANYSFLENDFESQIPTQASAMSLQLSIADDPTLAGFIALKKAAATRSAYPFRAQMPDGSVIFYYGYVSLNETPTMNKGSVMACQATFSLMSVPVRYAA